MEVDVEYIGGVWKRVEFFQLSERRSGGLLRTSSLLSFLSAALVGNYQVD